MLRTSGNQTGVDWTTEDTSFRVAGHRPVRPHERSLEPLTETDGDETMMDNPGDDDAGETSAVQSTIQPMKPSDQEIATHEACGHCPHRDWSCACVGGAGRSDAHKRRHEEQNGLHVASMDYGFFTDAQEPTTPEGDSDITKGATPFLVVNVKPSMVIWSMLVQCEGVRTSPIKETAESLNRLTWIPQLIVRSDCEPAMLAFRDAVIKEPKDSFCVREVSQAPAKYDSACAGMVENAIKLVKEKLRTLVIATRQLHGIVVDPVHVALA